MAFRHHTGNGLVNAETIPSRWTRGYVHSARLVCFSCDGSGQVEGYTCGVCVGAGTYQAGCGGAAELDEEHPAIGANCFRCGMVASEEVVKA